MTQTSATPTVVSLPSESSTFPQLPTGLIDRPQLINALDTMLEGDIQVVLLEGEEGIGKSTLGAQFALAHPDEAFTVFAAGPSALARSTEFLLADLCDQIGIAVRGKRPPVQQDLRALLRQSLVELSRLASRRPKPYLFVIDGLFEKPEDEHDNTAAMVLDVLPLGIRGFKFLITAPSDQLSSDFLRGVIVKPFTVTGFSLDEARSYLDDFRLPPSVLSEVYRAFRGVPGKLASVRRLLERGVEVLDVCDKIPTTFFQLFELEWKAVAHCSSAQLQVLAFLAHSRHNLTVEQLETLSGIPAQEILNMRAQLPFLTWDQNTQVVTFVSASFKAFARSKLDRFRAACIDRIIDLLLTDTSSIDSVEHLAGYMQDVGRADEIISYFSPEHLASVCDRLRSLTPVRTTIERGVQISERLRKPIDALRFGLQRALVAELEEASVLTSEVEARIKVEGLESAFSVANGAFLREDRLQLLSKIVRHQKEAGEYSDPGLLDEIRRLVSTADFSTCPNRAIDIAEDLMLCAPDLVMTLVEKASTAEPESGLDLALVRLSLAAADTKDLGADAEIWREAIVERIGATRVKQLARAARLFTADYDVNEILGRCEAMSSPEEALFPLERWCVENRKSDQAFRATEYGLKLILKATTYTPSARVVRRVCAALPFSSADHPYEANTIVQQVDAQAEMLRTRGPAVEYARLQMYLAETVATWDVGLACTRIEDLFLFIDTLRGVTRAEALARCLAALKRDETGRLREPAGSLLALFEESLDRSVPDLLNSTAEHAEVFDRIVHALGPVFPKLSRRIILAVNTAERRDALRQRFVLSHFESDAPLPDASSINEFLNEFELEKASESCVSEVINQLYRNKLSPLTRDWDRVLLRTLSLRSAIHRHISATKAYVLASRSADLMQSKAFTLLRDEMHRAFCNIDSAWAQIDVGFSSAGALSDISVEEARTLYKGTLQMQRQTNIPNAPAAIAYVCSLRLAMRAFVGLIRRKLPIEESLSRLRGLISKVPSAGERARLWAELALRCFSSPSLDIAKSIVQSDLLAAVQMISDERFRHLVLVEVAPALFKLHRQVAFDALNQLDVAERDEGLAEICYFILTGQPRGEPVDMTGRTGIGVGYASALDILDCLELIRKDVLLHVIIKRLCDGILSEDAIVTRDQRAEIHRRLLNIATTKFPAPGGIQHEGYRIVVEANIERLKNASESAWLDFERRADDVPNVCDRCLVLLMVAEAAPSRFHDLRWRVLQKAHAAADAIPWEVDRAGRFLSLAQVAAEVDGTFARDCLRSGFTIQANGDKQTIEERRRAMVDLACRIDPDFAKSLVSMLDDDPARARERDRLRLQLQVRQAKRDLSKDLGAAERLKALSAKGVADLCWSLLAGLNSRRVGTVKVDSTLPYLRIAGGGTLSEAYPVLAWAIENFIQRHDDTEYGLTHLADLFKAMAFTCDFALRLIGRANGLQHEWSSLPGITEFNDPGVIHAGEREKAIGILRAWLIEHRPSYIKICDPYFTPSDLGLLALIQDCAPGCHIQLLISEKKQRESHIADPLEQAYQQHWRLHISDQAPPDTDIMVVSISGSGDSPIHDRWMIGPDADFV